MRIRSNRCWGILGIIQSIL